MIRDADEVRQLARADGTMVAPLFPYERRFGFEYMELTFLAGFERLSDPHEAGIVEYITVISGSMDVLVDDIWHPLALGQTIRFRGDKPHMAIVTDQMRMLLRCRSSIIQGTINRLAFTASASALISADRG